MLPSKGILLRNDPRAEERKVAGQPVRIRGEGRLLAFEKWTHELH